MSFYICVREYKAVNQIMLSCTIKRPKLTTPETTVRSCLPSPSTAFYQQSGARSRLAKALEYVE